MNIYCIIIDSRTTCIFFRFALDNKSFEVVRIINTAVLDFTVTEAILLI